VNGSRWQIEHGCPQCGAPVTLDETDRLLACPFCRTRLYLVAKDYFRYFIPPSPADIDGELLYLPYWRLRGSCFSIDASEVAHRFVDTTSLAVDVPELPVSLGLRPQVMKLCFVLPDTKGRFIAPETPFDRALPAIGATPKSAFYRNFIGEAVSLLHAPLLLRGDTLHDAVLGTPVSAWTADDMGRLKYASLPAEGQARFIPTICPRCGWDMEGEKDSLVLICRNCNTAWTCPDNEFRQIPFTVMTPPRGKRGIAVYIPFWRMQPRIEGLALASHADLIRAANLPKAMTPSFANEPLYFWSPAFKINPSLYLRWAKQMTTLRPMGSENDRLPEGSLYPVTLPLNEAVEGIIVTIARMSADKRRLYPKLAGLRVALEESRLEYHPFVLEHNEWIHASLRISLDRTSLAYGIRM
jgi:DNA-directed RNA polymerase subunit RPC12/RpoP